MDKKKMVKRILIGIVVGFIALGIAFLVYASDYMHTDDSVTYENAIILDNGDIYLEGTTDTGIIFYPGAKVEASAYLPLFQKLNDLGYHCIIVKMPLNFAFLGIDSADEYYDMFPEIDMWYMAGHSLGGAMASKYASDNENIINGLILLGSYLYGDYTPEKSITIYGENDLGLDLSKVGDVNVHEISGGNHAAFGNYGKQKGDGELNITREEQQDITVKLIDEFINERNNAND